MSNFTSTLPLLLKELRLSGMLYVWEELGKRAHHEKWACEKYLSVLCDHELDQKQQNRIQRCKKESHLPVGKTFEAFEEKNITPGDWKRLESLYTTTDWVDQAHNVLFFGASGVGKSHLAAALGHQLILQGKRVLFSSTTAMVQRLRQAHVGLALIQEIMKLDRYQVLILDDIGYVQKEDQEMHVLFELITHRYEHRSLILTSNQPFSQWDKIFKDQAMTVAAVDRLVHHALIFELNGESYRRRQALSHNTDETKTEKHSSQKTLDLTSVSNSKAKKVQQCDKKTTTKEGDKSMT